MPKSKSNRTSKESTWAISCSTPADGCKNLVEHDHSQGDLQRSQSWVDVRRSIESSAILCLSLIFESVAQASKFLDRLNLYSLALSSNEKAAN